MSADRRGTVKQSDMADAVVLSQIFKKVNTSCSEITSTAMPVNMFMV